MVASRRRARRVLWTLAAAGIACAPAEPPPNILLVTLDTTRADHIGAYGSAVAQTPTIDRLAREGVVFEMALAPTPLTLPSHASILTGVDPTAHGVHDNGLFALPPEATLVSEVLQQRGWRTGAFVAAYVLDARFGLHQGFEVYRGVTATGFEGRHFERTADRVVDEALAWIRSLPEGDPWFAWLHFYDPHHPYRPPAPWSQRLEDPYDGEIAFADAQLGRLLDALGADEGGERMLTVVTSDHGEGLGDHGERTHGTYLYQPTQRVPLVLAGEPVAAWRGSRVSGAVSIRDVAPTLLALLGIPAEALPAARGPALLPPDPDAPRRPVYLESYHPYYAHRWRGARGLVWQDQKLIEGSPPELYSLSSDPEESRNLAASQPDELDAMRKRLEAFLAADPPQPWDTAGAPTQSDVEMLEALGYASGSRGDGDPVDPGLPLARDRTADVELLREAAVEMRRWHRLQNENAQSTAERAEREKRGREHLEAARAAVVRVLEANPHDPTAQLRLAKIDVSLGNFEAALPVFEDMVRDQPRTLSHRYNLGLAYDGAGRFADAQRAMRELLEVEPGYVKAYLWLGRHHADRGEYPVASWWLAEALEFWGPEAPRRAQVEALLEEVDTRLRESGQTRTPPLDL
jgi:arylsulfatase A-like enzyme